MRFFNKDKNRITQWKAFKKKAKITEAIEFETVMIVIKTELEPIYRAFS